MYKETAWVGWWVDVQWVVLIIKGVRRVRTGRPGCRLSGGVGRGILTPLDLFGLVFSRRNQQEICKNSTRKRAILLFRMPDLAV